MLNPLWVTQAVYRIITSQELADSHGVLTLDQIEQILCQSKPEHFDYPDQRRIYIIDLMKKDKFELCYQLPADQQILIPDLLHVEEPTFAFPTEDILRFRFEYDFLPRSILPRFIVRRHEEITTGNDGKPLQWRTGVVLSGRDDLQATAVVWSDNRDRKIMISVDGRDRREFFREIRREFGSIHETFKRLDVSQKVPLPDEPDVDVDYDDLVFHRDEGVAHILVGEVRRKYSVQDLLDGIERSEHRAPTDAGHKQRAVRAASPAEWFHVFLSHNSKDKASVRLLNGKLKAAGITTWLDEEQLRPGLKWQSALEDIVRTCESAAVCVGPSGEGPWHVNETEALLNRFGNENPPAPVIPVLLPDAPADVELPLFLESHACVDLRDGLTEESIDRLIWGITGRKPGS